MEVLISKPREVQDLEYSFSPWKVSHQDDIMSLLNKLNNETTSLSLIADFCIKQIKNKEAALTKPKEEHNNCYNSDSPVFVLFFT